MYRVDLSKVGTWISNYIPQHSVECNYLSLPYVPALGTSPYKYNEAPF